MTNHEDVPNEVLDRFRAKHLGQEGLPPLGQLASGAKSINPADGIAILVVFWAPVEPRDFAIPETFEGYDVRVIPRPATR